MYCGIQIFLTMRENVGSINWEIQKVGFLEYEGKNYWEIWETKGVFDVQGLSNFTETFLCYHWCKNVSKLFDRVT